jgi:hypothetical protein
MPGRRDAALYGRPGQRSVVTTQLYLVAAKRKAKRDFFRLAVAR